MGKECVNTISVIGLREAPKRFANALATLTGIPSGDFELQQPYEKFGVTIPRFEIVTKEDSLEEAVSKASKVFPELTFHIESRILPDGPFEEAVIRKGETLEGFCRDGSHNLFDLPVLYPTTSLLPAHLPYSLADYGALRVDDAIQIIEGLRSILDDRRFTDSPSQPYRDGASVERTAQALDKLLQQMKDAAKQLTFQGVLIEDCQCHNLYTPFKLRKEVPFGPVGAYESRASEALGLEAVGFEVKYSADGARCNAKIGGEAPTGENS